MTHVILDYLHYYRNTNMYVGWIANILGIQISDENTCENLVLGPPFFMSSGHLINQA